MARSMRRCAATCPQRRAALVEWMKLFLAIIPFPEISAARSMAWSVAWRPARNWHRLHMQMVDEFRHSTIQMNLKKWYMENYIDPAGFDITEAAFANATRPRSAASSPRASLPATDHGCQCLLDGRGRDPFTTRSSSPCHRSGAQRRLCPATVFLSVQSDESRHIGNGHSMLMAMINDLEPSALEAI